MSEPGAVISVKWTVIADVIGERSLNIGKDLHDLKERGLAVAEEEGLWKITPDGIQCVIEADKRKEASTPTETRTEDRTETRTN
jgi:hypothetical protein